MILDTLVAAMAAAKTDADAVSRAIGGRETSRGDDGTRRFSLNGDQPFDEAVMLVDDNHKPRSVELRTREGADVRLEELARRFGDWKRLPPTARKPHEIVFMQDGPGDHRVAIYVDLSKDAALPDARVQRVLLVRESKL